MLKPLGYHITLTRVNSSQIQTNSLTVLRSHNLVWTSSSIRCLSSMFCGQGYSVAWYLNNSIKYTSCLLAKTITLFTLQKPSLCSRVTPHFRSMGTKQLCLSMFRIYRFTFAGPIDHCLEDNSTRASNNLINLTVRYTIIWTCEILNKATIDCYLDITEVLRRDHIIFMN